MNSNRLDELRARLRAPTEKIPASFRRLGNALWNPDEDKLSHEQCREAMPSLILAQVMGEPFAERFSPVKHHLDHCDECATEYAELLDMALAEQRGALRQPANIPRPDLAFLPTPQETLQTRVREWTRNIVGQLMPKSLDELDAVARVFFGDLGLRQAHEEKTPYTLALSGEPSETAAMRSLLVASYATTELLVENVTRQEFDRWMNDSQSTTQVRNLASYTALSLGLEAGLQTIFSNAYTEAVLRDPSELRDLLQSARGSN
jgi:hypothetical protein